ncbi:ABC transporter ATP-binding protein [Pseudochelatococcus sp. B33]
MALSLKSDFASPDTAVNPGGRTPDIRLWATGLKKTFTRSNGEVVRAVDDVSIAVPAGKMLILLGPSGCGKTTLLRCIAGLERPDSGELWANDQVMFSRSKGVDVAPEDRGLSMMFQSYAVWPHMTVAENVAFPLISRGCPKRDIAGKVATALKRVGIPTLGDQYPNRLSGGQQQRVALARSLVVDPKVVLFDEPLSNVDAKVREDLRVELAAQQQEVGFAGIYVTHDQVEALQLADTVAVMREGRCEQLGPPEEVYHRPATRYVANFVGRVNELEATVLSGGNGEGIVVETPLGTFRGTAMAKGLAPGTRAIAVFRPEVVTHDKHGRNQNAFRGTSIRTQFAGAYRDHIVRAGDGLRILVSEMGSRPGERMAEGAELMLGVDAANVLLYPR